jgi:hypothetical protein
MFCMGTGDDNSLQGDYGETWLRVVAAGSGLLHGRPTSLDLEKADVELVRPGQWDGVWNPTVKVQVKTTHDLRLKDDHYSYDLDVETYSALRRGNETVRRVLAVFRVPKDGERVRLLEDGTLLAGCGAWVCLEGHPETRNTFSQVVKLPIVNTIDRRGLERMLQLFGGRASAQVPDVDAWGVS